MKVPTTQPRMAFVVLALALGTSCAAQPATAADVREWNFTVSLDGKPIGTHRFELRSGGGIRTVESDARFDVRVLGWTAYRYRHRASERWNGDCLASIAARTDDDGRLSEVRGRQGPEGFVIDSSPPAPAAPAVECVMSFAYWNRAALAAQQRLLDPGTGRIEPVEVAPLPPTSIEVNGRAVAARGVRISGLRHPIDVWYASGEWIGLDTIVEHGRHLSYRLQ